MSDIAGISSALKSIQSNIQSKISINIIKQAAKADQALADMLAENAKAASGASPGQTATSGISIYV